MSDAPRSELYNNNNNNHELETPVVDEGGSGTAPSAFNDSASKSRTLASGLPRTLASARSNPALLPSRPAGLVKDMASKWESSGLPPLSLSSTERENSRRPSIPGRTTAPRSPVSASSGEGKERVRLQKKRPAHTHKSTAKSPSTSFEANSSFSSVGTTRTTRSQPHSAFSPKHRPTSPKQHSRPLFGEITADGIWNGNFELGNYGPLPTFEKTPRRGSEGSLALGHGRSQSHQDIATPSLAPPQPHQHKLNHQRSRSDMDALRPQAVPSMPDLGARTIPTLYPTPPDSISRNSRSRPAATTSRIPISNRQGNDSSSSFLSSPYTRSASSMSSHRRKLSKSPTRPSTAKGKENNAPPSRSRYAPPPIPTASSNQTLSAKIVAPPAITSPPLRSSRPRQPVSAATTSASRARAAERFVSANPGRRDIRRPSEQWLGKPYDPQKERSRRKIPELDNVDFAERRARIQKAITASLRSNDSYESLRSASRSQSRSQTRSASRGPVRLSTGDFVPQAIAGAERMQQREGSAVNGHSRGLSVETTSLQAPHAQTSDLLSAQTEKTFFEDESPVLGRAAAAEDSEQPQVEDGGPQILLAPVTYQPPSRSAAVPSTIELGQSEPAQPIHSPSVLDNVMRMRRSSGSDASGTGTEFADDSPSARDSTSDADDRWGSGIDRGADQGSIRIMLDEDPETSQHAEPWLSDMGNSSAESRRRDSPTQGDVVHTQAYNERAFAVNGYTESPDDDAVTCFPNEQNTTPKRQTRPRDDTLRPTVFRPDASPGIDSQETLGADGAIARVLEYYQSTGSLTPDMLEEVQHRMVDLHRLSANGGSNGIMIQSLLDSVLDSQAKGQSTPEKQMLQAGTYEMPSITPDTPPMGDGFVPGTVIVYGNETPNNNEDDEDDFEAKIRKADEAWERQQRGEDPFAQEDDENKPTPPPKDFGYTPRSSTVPSTGSFTPSMNEAGFRLSTISTTGGLDLHDIHAAADRANATPPDTEATAPDVSSAPSHAPPPVPNETSLKPSAFPDLALPTSASERGSSDLSPRLNKGTWAQSSSSRPPSSRPSTDSQRIPPSLPTSQSMTSVSETTRVGSVDTGRDGATKTQSAASPAPEHKRLLRRRHIIKELLDTENSYHQDLKIIEDIYKATCTPELVQPEDKKVLFGNCDEVEKFALHFYDEMRKAVSQVYTPPKQHRWMNKRGSFSTTQSDGTTSTFTDAVDNEKDQTTTIGRTFLMNIPQMENVYGTYLKNHDAANQRLSAIQSTTTVKCWLDECHANASDITSAWDLDSLLVKPTQRVAKYPMLLQQLLEVTPSEHPDHGDLKSAVKDSIAMLTRINDAKKRADLVDQIINPGKRKDTDLRSGLAKAFGRRTEKLKERVGIAEAFQDPAFDDLAHKFGGHFIRLQICMRDVQDYMHRTDKAIELINNYANALELFTDVSPSTLPEIESKYRKYGQVIRDLTLIAFGEHKADVQKRVLAPMIQCIKLHEGPQNAINKRKKKIVDYAKCKSEERRGQKPDKKTVEASELYVALNEQLKIDLPKLYTLTAQLVQNCLNCFIDIQLKWQGTWERKLKPLLEAADVPSSIQQIEPAFKPDFVEIERRCNKLSICNGTLKVEAASFLSTTPTLAESSETTSKRRPSTLDSSNRTLSVGSESSHNANNRRHSGIYSPGSEGQFPADSRNRSSSAIASRQPAPSAAAGSRPWPNSAAHTPSSSFSATRPATADSPSLPPSSYFPRQSHEAPRSHRPTSDASYYTARPTPAEVEQHRFSGLFSSALPPDVTSPPQEATPPRTAPADMPILFVCASLFEFSIDRTRKEGGYPYLQYVQGEVFDVLAQKGELWLAKNQDDPTNELGWIWEQHFIILSSEN